MQRPDVFPRKQDQDFASDAMADPGVAPHVAESAGKETLNSVPSFETDLNEIE
jgi:hypothetical protein